MTKEQFFSEQDRIVERVIEEMRPMITMLVVAVLQAAVREVQLGNGENQEVKEEVA